jgi:hypothetical protein
VRQMLTILTRDESFHVPLNVHFLREALAHASPSPVRMKALYHGLTVALIASAAASRRRAGAFDGIPFRELASAYAEHLGRLFLHEPDLALTPSAALLRAFGLSARALAASEDLSAVSIEAAERAVDRARTAVTAL